MKLYDGDLLAVLVCITTTSPNLLPCAPCNAHGTGAHGTGAHGTSAHGALSQILNPPGQITCTLLSAPACIYLH